MTDGPALGQGAPAVPLIDLAPLRAGADPSAVVALVRAACEQIGFLILTGHGVPPAVTGAASDASRAFFDQPRAEKERLPLTPQGAGYSPLRGETLARTLGQAAPADLKESLNFGGDPAAFPWPPRPAGLRAALSAYFAAMEHLAAEMLSLFARCLSLPPNYFAQKVNPSSSFLRVINYPPPEAEPEPGQLRAGAHTDYGILTILRSENVAGGLQVRSRAGEWLDVQAPDGALVINLGDMLMRWTNDRWLSTLHRVINPPASAWGRSRRQSLVFFHNPNPDAMIECLPGCCDFAHPAQYPPIRAGDFIREKSRQAYGR
jgi:isopenicillin N synthase-like dioxygenase